MDSEEEKSVQAETELAPEEATPSEGETLKTDCTPEIQQPDISKENLPSDSVALQQNGETDESTKHEEMTTITTQKDEVEEIETKLEDIQLEPKDEIDKTENSEKLDTSSCQWLEGNENQNETEPRIEETNLTVHKESDTSVETTEKSVLEIAEKIEETKKEPSPDCALIEADLKKILFSPLAAECAEIDRKDGKIRIAKSKNRVAEKKKKGLQENGETYAKKAKTEEPVKKNRTSSDYQKLAPLDRTAPMDERVYAMMREDVHPLKKKNNKFPMAAYVCRLCSYHCDTMDVCERHVRDAKHKQLKENRELDLLLKNLPPLSPAHIQALDAVIEKTVAQYALPIGVVGHRQALVRRLEATIQEEMEDVTLELYGSSVNGFGLKTSDINIDIILPKNRSASETLKAVYKLLKEKSNYVNVSNVSSDFQAKIPSISFNDSVSDVSVQLSLGNHLARYTTQLLATYSKIDDRVQKIGVALRYLAKICEIDQQLLGTLPAHSFALMTVYFLQRTTPPVLPVLHEIYGEGRKVECEGKELSWFFDDIDKLGDHLQTRNEVTCGELWVQLFRFYCTTFDLNRHVVCIRQRKVVNRDDKKWSHKKLAIEDPFATRLNLSRSVSHTKNLDYIHDCLKHACKYYGIPQTKTGPLFKRIPLKQQKKANDSTKPDTLLSPKMKVVHETPDHTVKDTRSCKEIAHGIVDIAVENMRQEFEKCNVSVLKDVKTDHLDNIEYVQLDSDAGRERERIRSETLDKKARTVILDSFSCAYLDILDSKSNNALHASLQYNEIHNVVQPTGETEGKDDDEEDEAEKTADDSIDHVKNVIDDADASVNDSELNDLTTDIADLDDSIIGTPVPKKKILLRENSDDVDDDEDITELMDAHAEEAAGDIGDDVTELQMDESGDASKMVLDESSRREGDYYKLLLEGLKSKDLMFTFDKAKLTDGRKPSIVCSVCQTEGHLKNDCPESILPDVKPLKPLSEEFKKLLNEVLSAVPDEYMPSDKETAERQEILQELERFIRETYEKCNLCMFGSSCNQFGFKNSDLDICMTLEGVDDPKELNCIEIIEKVAQKLKEHKLLYNVSAITTAKVPIVKFKHRKTQLEADISLYNTLALHNTRLLDRYAAIDPRVRTLGHVIKVFAKVCDIGDASRGSLSSYAYILMLLYYLQRCEPPVIPCLQEMYDGERPTLMIDGCDAWFFDDLEAIPNKWPAYQKNTQSVAELWLGLLCFYVEQFDFKEHVISIRQLKPLTRFEKLWNGKSIAIEDPFDLNHNLGAGLSRKMNTFIMKAFINARHRFGTSIETGKPPGKHETFQKYLFDVAALVEGLPPTDRGCRSCGKIGHIARECAYSNNRRGDYRDRRVQDRMGPGPRGPIRPDQRRDMVIRPMLMERRRGPPMPFGPPVHGPHQSFHPAPPPRGTHGSHVYYNSGMRSPMGRGFPPPSPYDNRFPPGHPARMRSPQPHMFGQRVMDPRHISHLRAQNPDARFPPPGHYTAPPPSRPARPPPAGYAANHRPSQAPARPTPAGVQRSARKDELEDGETTAGQSAGERAATNGEHQHQHTEKQEEEEESKDEAARRHELDAQEKLERGIRAPPSGKTNVIIGKQDSRLDPNYEELCKKVVEDRQHQQKLHQQHLEELEKQRHQNHDSQSSDLHHGQGQGHYHNREWHDAQSRFDGHHHSQTDHHSHQQSQQPQQQQQQSHPTRHGTNQFSQARPNYQQREVYSPNKQGANVNFNNSNRDALGKEFKDGKVQAKDKLVTSQSFSSTNHFSADTQAKDSPVAPVAPQWKKTHGPMLLQRPPGVTSGQLPLPVDLGLDKAEEKAPDTSENTAVPPFQIGLAAASQRMMFNKDSLVNQMLPAQPFRSPNRPPSPASSTSPLALLNQSISPSKRFNQAGSDPYRKRRSPSKDQPPRFQQGKPAVRQLDQTFGQDVEQNQTVFQPMVNPQLQSMVPVPQHYLFYPTQHNYQPRPEQKEDLFSRESMFPQHVMSQALSTFQGHPIFPQQSQQHYTGPEQQPRTDDHEHKFDQYPPYQQETSQFGQQRDVYGQHHVYYNQNQMANAPIQNPVQDTAGFYQQTPQSQSAALTGTQIWFTSMAQPNFAQQEQSAAQQSMAGFNYRTQPSPGSGLGDRTSVQQRNDPWVGGNSSMTSYPGAQVSDWLQQPTAAQQRLDQQQLSGFSMAPTDASATNPQSQQLFPILDATRPS